MPKTTAAWRALVRRIQAATRRSADAEDLLQAAFVRMQEYARRQPVENPAGFLVRTAVNLSIDAARQQASRGELLMAASDLGEVVDDQPLQDEVLQVRKRLEDVKRALAELSPRTRDIFLMHRIDGLKYREIAEREGVTVSAVEKHIAKAVLHLSQMADEA
ncbi:MAG: sigma-70 family RNA polymerase sigma factor [Caulobacterales bacterium]|nr:sigma-70 family RNA polymerase sigma factor [Caulobacterales bacterium]